MQQITSKNNDYDEEIYLQQRAQRAQPPPRQQLRRTIKIDAYPKGANASNSHSNCIFHLAFMKGCTRSEDLCSKDHFQHDLGSQPHLQDTAREHARLERVEREHDQNDGQGNGRRRSNSQDSQGSNGSLYSRGGTKRRDKKPRQERPSTPFQ